MTQNNEPTELRV